METIKDIFVMFKVDKVTEQSDVYGVYEDEEHCQQSCRGFEERYTDYSFCYEQFNIITRKKLKR